MVLWLLQSNGLWERAGRAGPTEAFVDDNVSTVVTLFLPVLGLYLTLFVVILGAEPGGDRPGLHGRDHGVCPSFSSYVDIAWLSAAMGVVAGGLGTSFDERTDIRQLTHGRREMQRRPDPGPPPGR